MKRKERIKERIELNKIKRMYKENGLWNINVISENLVMRNY